MVKKFKNLVLTKDKMISIEAENNKTKEVEIIPAYIKIDDVRSAVEGALEVNKIYCGDSARLLNNLPDKSIDLIMTSPPYADRRKKNYKSIPAEKYIDWFLPISEELFRVLKPSGSFILNIKEHTENGEKQTYVIKLILELKRQGWYWVEDYIWHKLNSFPGKWPNRFRDSWEHCLHFTKNKKFKMYQENVKEPIGSWAKTRMSNLSQKDKVRNNSSTNSGMGRNLINWVGKRKVYPSNVLSLPTVSANLNHSAVFPENLPSWFIKVFTKKGDVVLDPFVGSGTTAIAALKLDRKYIGFEIDRKYCKTAKSRIREYKCN